MSNYRVKIKINDYFPKIDAIPYDDFICLISCNNFYSRIKLTEYESRQFKFDLKIIKNVDLLFTIKVINYVDNNKLVGMYNLIIPHNKVNQILQREISLYKQQIKLIMNSNIKIKLFGIMMNITNIYLDLIFQITSINDNIPINNNQMNKLKLYDMLGNNSYAKNYSKNKRKNKTSNVSLNEVKKSININLSKSPIVNYNNFVYKFTENESKKEKKYTNNKMYNNNGNQNHSDINFNVMNYNYLNYLKIDGNNNDNNFEQNYKFNMNNKSPLIISKNDFEINEQNNYNLNIKPENNNSYYNILNKNKINEQSNREYQKNDFNYIKYQNAKTNKKEKGEDINLDINPFILKTNNSDINSYIFKYQKKNAPQCFTESKKNVNIDKMNNGLRENQSNNKLEKNPNYQNLIKNNSNHKISYINYINKNKNILYDKKNHLNKYINSNKTNKQNISSKKDNKINKEKENAKTQVFRNKINIHDFDENETENPRMETPRNIKKTDSNINASNTPFHQNISTIKKQTNEYLNLNTMENQNLNLYQLTEKIDNIMQTKNTDIQNKSEIIENKEFNLIDKNNTNKIQEPLILTQGEIKDKLIKSIEENQKKKKEISSLINKNRDFMNQFIFKEEKYYAEFKLKNRLTEKKNSKNIKYYIHVNIRGNLNENLYFSQKKIKDKESQIFLKIFYEYKTSPQYKALQAKKKVKEKLEQQKKIHALLNILRELIKKYENLSQIYNDDEKKKILFKSLLLRYGIREKEESKENNLLDKFNEIKKELEEEKNKKLIEEKKKEIQGDLYKNVIKEEDDEERSSISEHVIKGKNSLKQKLSWCSDDSIFKEKENFESNKSNYDDLNNSLLGSGLKKIKESNDEEVLIENEKKEEKQNTHFANDKEKATLDGNINAEKI